MDEIKIIQIYDMIIIPKWTHFIPKNIFLKAPLIYIDLDEQSEESSFII